MQFNKHQISRNDQAREIGASCRTVFWTQVLPGRDRTLARASGRLPVSWRLTRMMVPGINAMPVSAIVNARSEVGVRLIQLPAHLFVDDARLLNSTPRRRRDHRSAGVWLLIALLDYGTLRLFRRVNPGKLPKPEETAQPSGEPPPTAGGLAMATPTSGRGPKSRRSFRQPGRRRCCSRTCRSQLGDRTSRRCTTTGVG